MLRLNRPVTSNEFARAFNLLAFNFRAFNLRNHDQRSSNSTCENDDLQVRRRCYDYFNENMGLLSSYPRLPSQVNIPSYWGLRPPGPPAIYPSNPQNPQTHFHRHSNGVLVDKHHFHTWNLNCANLERAQFERAQVE